MAKVVPSTRGRFSRAARLSALVAGTTAATLALTGCPKRELRVADAGVEAGVRTAPALFIGDGGVPPPPPLPIGDAGLPSLVPVGQADAGAQPADDALPTAGADLVVRGKHLLEAIATGNAELGNDMLFPRDAYLQVRDVADAPKVWEKKVLGGFQRDIATYHKRLKGKDAQFVALEVGQAITRVVPKKKDLKKPLWRVRHSKLVFTVDGRPQRVEIAELTSWRGAWYVTKLK